MNLTEGVRATTSKPLSALKGGQRARFASLKVGRKFRLPTVRGYVGGTYVKTGAGTYGLKPGAPFWCWFGEPVEYRVEVIT
ncbi:MAG: hypothetical protein JWQ04_2826 [Pedosphaera sp.]|nr:hypothetical protein [Pedosphaera sp.]